MPETMRNLAHFAEHSTLKNGSEYGCAQKPPPPWVPPWVRQIIAEACAADPHRPQATPADVFARDNRQIIVRVRTDAIRRTQAAYEARTGRKGWSQIGRWFRRHHSSVMYSCGVTTR